MLLLRNLVMVTAAVMLHEHPGLQGAFSIVAILIYAFGVVYFRPFQDSSWMPAFELGLLANEST